MRAACSIYIAQARPKPEGQGPPARVGPRITQHKLSHKQISRSRSARLARHRPPHCHRHRPTLHNLPDLRSYVGYTPILVHAKVILGTRVNPISAASYLRITSAICGQSPRELPIFASASLSRALMKCEVHSVQDGARDEIKWRMFCATNPCPPPSRTACEAHAPQLQAHPV
jgi:hypothetical protein